MKKILSFTHEQYIVCISPSSNFPCCDQNNAPAVGIPALDNLFLVPAPTLWRRQDYIHLGKDGSIIWHWTENLEQRAEFRHHSPCAPKNFHFPSSCHHLAPDQLSTITVACPHPYPQGAPGIHSPLGDSIVLVRTQKLCSQPLWVDQMVLDMTSKLGSWLLNLRRSWKSPSKIIEFWGNTS